MPHWFFIIFLFVLGACVGSFLNVVVWRLPRGQSLVSPGSHCPKCDHALAWYDNIPVFGWIMLASRCRYCREPISIRYPIVEAVTGLLFVFYYVMFFIVHIGPCAPEPLAQRPMFFEVVGRSPPHYPDSIFAEWHVYGLYMLLVAGLVAVTLIDAELFIIPLEIPYVIALVALIVHAIIDRPTLPGALNLLHANQPTIGAALAAGGGVGLLLSILLWWRGILPVSFPEGEPSLEVDQDAYEQEVTAARERGEEPPPPLPTYVLAYERAVQFAKEEGRPVPAKPAILYTPSQVRAEIRKEILFLLPPLLMALAWLALTHYVAPIRAFWLTAARSHWLSGLLGSLLGGMVGGLIVWVVRIFGSLFFGRVAMGLGDVHLMVGVGAVIGPGAAAVAFFLAPFGGLLVGVWNWLSKRRHELPLGPYLSLATGIVILCYCPIADYLRPGIEGLSIVLRDLMRSWGL